MPKLQRKPRTILHFCCERTIMALREWFLSEAGYCVLSTSGGFDAISMVTSGQVDAAVLDMGRNRAETMVVAREIKRLRPYIPTIVLAEGTAPPDDMFELADTLVPRDDPDTLVKSLECVLVSTEPSGAVA